MRFNFKFLILAIFLCGFCVSFEQAAIAQAEQTEAERQRAANIVFEGEMIDGVKWADSSGDNVLIVSGKKTLAGKNAAVATQRIFGYHYVTKNAVTKLLWKIQDFAENQCETGKTRLSPIFLQDINQDGIAESMFVYNLKSGCDATAAAGEFKLMMHSGATKLAVRTAKNNPAANAKTTENKIFDPAFNRAPAEFKTAASEYWDKYAQESNGK